MKPSSRRRVERHLRKMMEVDGDKCSLCKKPFPHNGQTFGGVTSAGVPAMVSECCRPRLKEIVLSGVYVNRSYDGMRIEGDTRSGASLPPDQIMGAVDQLQKHFAAIDKLSADIARRGGIHSDTPNITFSETAWKTDDAAWFKNNPARSHRLRPVFSGEDTALSKGSSMSALPLGHEFQVLVRQIEPGKRVRTPFYTNVKVPIPNDEAIIHALFDMLANPSRKQGVVSIDEVAELAKKYSNVPRDNPKERPT